MGGMNYYLYGRGDPKVVRLSLSGRGTCAPFLMFFTSVFLGAFVPLIVLRQRDGTMGDKLLNTL